MDRFREIEFERKVDLALQRVKAILDTTRNPVLPSSAAHTYDDKYALAETAIKTSLACQMNSLLNIGLDDEKLACLLEWCRENRAVTLQLTGQESCSFLRTTEREQESATSHVTEVKSSVFGSGKITNNTVTKITEHFWCYEAEWSLKAFAGGQSSMETKPLVIHTRKGSCELKTNGVNKVTPRPPVTTHQNIDLDFDFALRCFDAERKIKFDIDRGAEDCHTPRRNAQTQDAIACFHKVHRWTRDVKSLLQRTFYHVDPTFHQKNAGSGGRGPAETFSPVLAMFSFEESDEKVDDSWGRRRCPAISRHEYIHIQLFQGTSISTWHKRQDISRHEYIHMAQAARYFKAGVYPHGTSGNTGKYHQEGIAGSQCITLV